MRKSIKTAAIVAAMSVMVLGTVASVSAAEKKNGWVANGTTYNYYIDDKMSTNSWIESSGKWYFVDEDGKMATSKFVNDNSVIDKDEMLNITPSDDDLYYFVGSDGAMVTGWLEIDCRGKSSPTGAEKYWFYMSSNGRVYGEEWVYSGAKWYYLNANGQMLKQAKEDIDGTEYYFVKSGAMVTGWYKFTSDDNNKIANVETGSWIYADEDGELTKQGWVKDGSKWYYIGETGTTAAGTIDAEDIAGLSDVSGSAISLPNYKMLTDAFVMLPNNKGTGSEYFYFKADGSMAASAWVKNKIGSGAGATTDYYYASSDGKLKVKSVESISNKYYYFEDGIMADDSKVTYAWKAVKGSATVYGSFLKDTYATISEAKTAAEAAAPAGYTVTVYKLGTNSSK